MKISELISRLEALKDVHGDIQVRAYEWNQDDASEGPVNTLTWYEAHPNGDYPDHIEIQHRGDI